MHNLLTQITNKKKLSAQIIKITSVFENHFKCVIIYYFGY